jgi:hypothetical protein
MVKFEVVRVVPQGASNERGWVVKRIEPNGLRIAISPLYPTEYEAEVEANRLNLEAASRIMN